MGEQDEQLHRFLEQAFQERIGRFPQTLTALGRRDQKDRLDDQSESAAQDFRALLVGQLEAIGAFARDKLSPHAQLNVRVFEQDARQTLARLQYRAQEYLVNQKFGLHTDFPAFMINMHGVADLQDARDYVARLRAFGRACDQVIEELERREAMGIVPPAFLFPQMLDDCRRFVGDPSDTQPVDANVLLADLRAKLAELGDRGDPGEAGKDLLQAAAQALRETVLPGYERLIAFLERQESRAPAEGGAWSLPDGEAYYRMCLARHTTTALSADEIHRLGLDEVARIRGEMIALKGALGFGGYGDDELGTLFSHARDHDGFYYPQTPAGRAAYMEEMNAAIVEMKTLLPQYFASLPKDELLVKAVEPHRERTAGIAFYQGPAEDGSRPGIFYINLYDLRQLPRFTIEALAYHEALPGHHLQFSIANRLRDLPSFRRYADYTAYVEGWGLYSELLAKEAGLYRDPWSDFGRLVQELKRACRLVVDTGLHARRWTRAQAIDYMYENVPSSLGQIVKEVDRYIVMPGQATSYTVGMAQILALREDARRALGSGFDLRAFHDELLRHGPLPLDLLREQIAGWIGGNKAQQGLHA